MRIRNTISDYKRKIGTSTRLMETLEYIFFIDKKTGVIRVFDRKMNYICEGKEAMSRYTESNESGLYVWKNPDKSLVI